MRLAGVPPVLRAVAAVVVVFAGVAAAVVWREPPPLGVFDGVPPGSMVARQLDDGSPVFVRRGDSDVTVLSALSPGGYLLVWCPDAPGFIEPGPAFTFDEHGRYAFGGSLHGMLRYAATERDGAVVVTGELPPTPRWQQGAVAADHGPRDCFSTEGAVGGLEHPIAEDPVPVTELEFDGGWYAVRGFLDLDSERPSLCAAPEGGGCLPDDTSWVEVVSTSSMRSPIVDDLRSGRFDGVFVVRSDRVRR